MDFKLKYKSFHVAIVLVMLILTENVARLQAQLIVEPNKALLNEGDRTDILCSYGREIHYCRIEIPGEKVLSLNPKWNNAGGFTYFGKGLEAGECGVSIERVKGINNGQVKCSVGGEGQEFSASMDLVVAIRPLQPSIELLSRPDRDSYFSEGTPFRARCKVPGGRPPAKISWMLDEFPADKNVGPAELVRDPNGQENDVATVVQEIYWNLSPEDNNRKLICRAQHQTDRQDVPPQEAILTLYVKYQPVHRSESTVYGLYLDHTALVNVTIRANPPPVVEWNVAGKIIGQGQQNGRFAAFEPVPLGQDYYNVTLAIAGLTSEDTAQVYHLRASNALGTTDYQVRVSSSSTPPLAGLNIAAIVGIIVAICVLIIVALLFAFAKVTNRWCFGEKSLKTARPETSDTESADINAASTATTATTAATQAVTDSQQLRGGGVGAGAVEGGGYIKENGNSVGGKKSKSLGLFNAIFKRVHEKYGEMRKGGSGAGGELSETEQARDVEEQQQEQTAATTVTTINADVEQAPLHTLNKEDKQLVYAELILKPTEAELAPSTLSTTKSTTTTTIAQNKMNAPTTTTTNTTRTPTTTTTDTAKSATEYAEIVYVQKPNAELNKQA